MWCIYSIHYHTVKGLWNFWFILYIFKSFSLFSVRDLNTVSSCCIFFFLGFNFAFSIIKPARRGAIVSSQSLKAWSFFGRWFSCKAKKRRAYHLKRDPVATSTCDFGIKECTDLGLIRVIYMINPHPKDKENYYRKMRELDHRGVS